MGNGDNKNVFIKLHRNSAGNKENIEQEITCNKKRVNTRRFVICLPQFPQDHHEFEIQVLSFKKLEKLHFTPVQKKQA